MRTETNLGLMHAPPMAHLSHNVTRNLEMQQIVMYLHGISIAIFDWLITIGDEFTLIWLAPWNLGKILFFLTRYPVFADAIISQYHELSIGLSPEHCFFYQTLSGWLQLFGIAIAEVILSVRVWALWERSRCIGVSLIVMAVAAIGAAIICLIFFHDSETFVAANAFAPDLRGCYPTGGNNVLYLDYLLLMVYETILVVLTLMKAVQLFTRGGTSFSYIFFRDGLMYFTVLLAISTVNVVIIFIEPLEFNNLLASLQRVLHAVFSARIILNLRQKNAETRMSLITTPSNSVDPNSGFEWFRDRETENDNGSVLAFRVPDPDPDVIGYEEEEEEEEEREGGG